MNKRVLIATLASLALAAGAWAGTNANAAVATKTKPAQVCNTVTAPKPPVSKPPVTAKPTTTTTTAKPSKTRQRPTHESSVVSKAPSTSACKPNLPPGDLYWGSHH